MTARDDVRDEFSWTPFAEQQAEYERLLDAFRAEVLNEAADTVFEMATDAPTTGQRTGLLNAVFKLRAMTPAPQPDTTKET